MCSPVLLRFLFGFLFVSSIAATSFYKKPLFSTANPYFWIRDENKSIIPDSAMNTTLGGKTCLAIYVDVLMRHGARSPEGYYIKDIDNLQSKLKNMSLIESNDFIESWVDPFTIEMAAQLTDIGKKEQYTLGKRFRKRFQSLLSSQSNIRYYATSKKRTQDSAKYFHQGMMGRDFSDDISDIPNPTIDDKMLRFFDKCKKYSDEIMKNKTAVEEYYKFESGPEMSAMTQNVSNRITGGEFNITVDDVLVILEICATEIGMFNDSGWCDFFTKDDLDLIVYMYDIYDYWLNAYGHAINSEISCPLFADIFRDMDKAIVANRNEQNYTVGTFRFAHAETLSHVFSRLSLFKDNTPLLASNYNINRNRKFLSNTMEPFSANFYQVLYKCGNSTEDLYVKAFVNEVAANIPECQGEICSYNTLKSSYEGCHFDQLCHNAVPTAPSTSSSDSVPTVPSTSSSDSVPTVPSTSSSDSVPIVPSTSSSDSVPTAPSTSSTDSVPTVSSTSPKILMHVYLLASVMYIVEYGI